MIRITRVLTASLCALLSMTALLPAWNDAGHRTIAFLAYSHLTPKAKTRVGEILRAHPDFSLVFNQGGSGLPPWDVSRNAFVTAATWPDLIRNDPRFNPSSPHVKGFPDMGRHTNWHFINMPIPAEFAKQPVDPDNGAAQLPKLIGVLRSSGPVTPAEAYALPWILHIVGDLHQPLHTVGRYSVTGGKPVHDRGGNDCIVQGNRKLHSVWDALLGRAIDDGSVARLAASLEDEHPAPQKVDRKVDTWVREGVAASTSHVYGFSGPCTAAAPAVLSPAYDAAAKDLARDRAALAAYRIAAVLNDKLGR